ncbi:MAG: ATPase, T2SS/T4P/T4SS family, partial [Candidatus Methanofastidiosia archaeon]
VAGSPGAGKSTFVQALAEFYKDQKKIVKTMEKPRDLQVSREITQYTSLSGEMEKTADILLLVRPDYTIFDEMRKTSDFVIFTDLRLAGVGMCGVVHANRAIDACQRFIGRIELGMIPQIIDTIIFIENGDIGKVFKLKLRVKVPFGMKVQDLARPVIEVKDFSSGRVEYEIYTFGEQVVVMPVLKRIRGDLTKRISRFLKSSNFEFEESEGRGTLYVANSKISEVIGRGGKKIAILEKVLGMPIDVKPFEDKIPVSMDFTKKTLKLYLPKKFANSVIDFYHEGEFLFQASISKKASISIERRTKLAKRLYEIYMQDKEVYGKVV